MKIYPAIDLLAGACVRLKQGGFDQATTYSSDPLAMARAFEVAGAEYLHLVDLSGARNPADRQLSLIGGLIKATGLKIQVGGGLRTLADASALLSLGADRVVFGSAIVADPALASRLLAEFGAERITLALDVRVGPDGVPRVATLGWQEQETRSAPELLAGLKGVSRVLCTDISRDGMMVGPNIPLYTELMEQFPSVEIQASGGVSSLDDLRALKSAGVRSAIVGKAIYEGALELREALREC